MVEQVTYKQMIKKANTLPFPILMKTFMALEDLTRQFGCNIKLDIPETIICTYDSSISYLYTDESGFVRSRTVKPEFLHDLAVSFYEKTEAKMKFSNCIYPISVTKFSNDYDNDTKLDFFINSLIERFNKNYQKSNFIIQRYIPNRGFNPCIFRIEYQSYENFRLYSIASKQQNDGKFMSQRKIKSLLHQQSQSFQQPPIGSNLKINNNNNLSKQFMSRNPIIRMDKLFIKNILMSNTYLNKRNIEKKRPVNDSLEKNTITDGFDDESDQVSKFDEVVNQPRVYKEMLDDSVYGLFFKVPIDMKVHELSQDEQQDQYDLFYNQTYIQDELDQYAVIKQQYLMEEDYFKQSTILNITNEAYASYRSILDQAAELKHFIDSRYLQKQAKQIENIVLDFTTDFVTNKFTLLQIKYATIKDLEKDSIVFDKLDKVVRQRHTRSIDATFQIAQSIAVKNSIKFECSGQYCKIEDFQIRKDIPEFHQELVHKISKRNDHIKGQGGVDEPEFIFQKYSQKLKDRSKQATDIHRNVKLLPEIQNFEYYIPNAIIILDKDIIYKYQEELIIKQELMKLRENLNLSLFEIHKVLEKSQKCTWEFLNTELEQKFKNIRVCYNCYSFYVTLHKHIINFDGTLDLRNIKRMTNPSFKELEKRKQDAKEIEQRVKIMMKNVRLRDRSLESIQSNASSPNNISLRDNGTRQSMKHINIKENSGLPPMPAQKKVSQALENQDEEQLDSLSDSINKQARAKEIKNKFLKLMTKNNRILDEVYFGKMESALDFIFNDEDEMRKPIKIYSHKNTNPINSHTVSSLAHTATPITSPMMISRVVREQSLKNDQYVNPSSYKQTPQMTPLTQQNKYIMDRQETNKEKKSVEVIAPQIFPIEEIKFELKLFRNDSQESQQPQPTVINHRQNFLRRRMMSQGQIKQNNLSVNFEMKAPQKFIRLPMKKNLSIDMQNHYKSQSIGIQNKMSILERPTDISHIQEEQHSNLHHSQSSDINDLKYSDKQILRLYYKNKLSLIINQKQTKEDIRATEQKIEDVLKKNINNYDIQTELVKDTYSRNEPKNVWRERLKENIKKNNKIKQKSKIVKMRRVELNISKQPTECSDGMDKVSTQRIDINQLDYNIPPLSPINRDEKETPELITNISVGQRVIQSMLDKYKIESVRELESSKEKVGLTTEIMMEQANLSTDMPNAKSSQII
ncbi:UNKNOWN [Stylonychia lemnae]|uniref:Uncharacterized protein n=1 Tax=Stylonychia lemnae TaxID=5949 RepID=A0A078BAT8_STYLE|nr:UNKNOWN [Stylonychia lemnae]|eukprot:CDW90678.1 UNKNOWN [Stylonychia lemnae]